MCLVNLFWTATDTTDRLHPDPSGGTHAVSPPLALPAAAVRDLVPGPGGPVLPAAARPGAVHGPKQCSSINSYSKRVK